ncbi:hypothetical protein LOAG_04453 [Loa loa]|uniref:Uncharacterized protein n=1 Tax=Loa loa TaxID=7209 RepID=A0A1S0U1Z3_LOALO|nr:hypothetical protein LOAG_04453 [Loa loa]EFO24028.2 hypothetical protein LOAG_04453 [Loa loa]
MFTASISYYAAMQQDDANETQSMPIVAAIQSSFIAYNHLLLFPMALMAFSLNISGLHYWPLLSNKDSGKGVTHFAYGKNLAKVKSESLG